MTENFTIENVTKDKKWFMISAKEGAGFAMETKWGVTPKVGDKVTLHCHRGSMVRGIDLNGEKVFYKTDEQLDQEHKEWCDNRQKEQEERFKKEKPKLDKRYKALPKCFQERIDRFRTNNPKFRVEFEGYEMYCCEQAIVMAKALSNDKKIASIPGFVGWIEYDIEKRFNLFRDLKWDQQKLLVKKLDGGHSGNTFGASCALAYWFLKQPENVSKIHGSLSTLVGSKAYGDIPQEIEK